MQDPSELLWIEDAAREVQRHPMTLRRWIRSGLLRSYKRQLDKRVYVNRTELHGLVVDHPVESSRLAIRTDRPSIWSEIMGGDHRWAWGAMTSQQSPLHLSSNFFFKLEERGTSKRSPPAGCGSGAPSR